MIKKSTGSKTGAFSIIYIDFQTYIKLTHQEIYFVEIYESFINRFGMCGLDFLSNDEILNWYDSIRNANLNNKKNSNIWKGFDK